MLSALTSQMQGRLDSGPVSRPIHLIGQLGIAYLSLPEYEPFASNRVCCTFHRITRSHSSCYRRRSLQNIQDGSCHQVLPGIFPARRCSHPGTGTPMIALYISRRCFYICPACLDACLQLSFSTHKTALVTGFNSVLAYLPCCRSLTESGMTAGQPPGDSRSC